MVTGFLTERMAFVLNLPAKQSVSIGTMLNFDGDGHGHGNGDGTCKRSLMKDKIDTCTSKDIEAIQTVLNTLLRIHAWSWKRGGQICNCDGIKLNSFRSPLLQLS